MKQYWNGQSDCLGDTRLHYTHLPDGTWASEVLRLSDVHRLILHLLGPAYENCYLLTQCTAK